MIETGDCCSIRNHYFLMNTWNDPLDRDAARGCRSARRDRDAHLTAVVARVWKVHVHVRRSVKVRERQRLVQREVVRLHAVDGDDHRLDVARVRSVGVDGVDLSLHSVGKVQADDQGEVAIEDNVGAHSVAGSVTVAATRA